MILHINAKLNVWAEWVASGRKIVGLGYPSQCAFTRLTPSSGSWRAPIMHDEAYEIEQAIHALDPYLRETINQFYLRAGTLETHEHGWIFCNETQASAMLMQKNSPKKSPLNAPERH